MSLILLFVVAMTSHANCHETDKNTITRVCFPPLGCFSTAAPFTSQQRPISVVPDSPDKILTKFSLYTRTSSNQTQTLDARYPDQVFNVWTNFINGSKTKFITHGFMDTVKAVTWMKEVTDELLKHGDYNVVVVDWSGGNQIDYLKATANTRIVGAQIAELINFMIESGKMTADDFHLIGHSLGAHISGYAGERIFGLGRITGLDPAGPSFEDTDVRLRLDATDALFVDVIHSHIKTGQIPGFGTKTICGHVDFFPNGGYDQPGCPGDLFNQMSTWYIAGKINALIACNHVISIYFFMKSINSVCPFLAFPCASEEDFTNNKCYTCGDVGCSSMGFHADQHQPPKGKSVVYYTRTAPEPPVCRYQYVVEIQFSDGNWGNVSGVAAVAIKGNKFESPLITLNRGNPTTFAAGQKYTFGFEIAADVNDIQTVAFWWKESKTKANQPGSVSISSIQIYRPESDIYVKFCSKWEVISSGSSLTFSTAC